MNIENTVNTIFTGMGIPSCVADSQNEIIISPRNMAGSVYSREFIAECRGQWRDKGENASLPLILSFDPGMLVGVAGLDGGNIFILGPVNLIDYADDISKYDDDFEIRHAMTHYPRFAGLMSLITELITGIEIPPAEIAFTNTSATASMQASEAIMLNNIFTNQEKGDFHTSTGYETAVLDAITAGDTGELKRRLSEPMDGKVGQLSGDFLRQHKYLFVALTTMASRAAIRGGMDEETARSLVDAYCMQMDECGEVQDIIALAYKMAFDYCEKVSMQFGKAPYSPLIKKCVTYISRHLHEDIKLVDLALLCRLSTRGVSKKFREETGMAISEFIHQKKMREACYLLKYSDYGISEIGNILQYNTQSYFTKVFRDLYNTTPKQFRDTAHKGRRDYDDGGDEDAS